MDSLLPSCTTLSFATTCRFIPAHPRTRRSMKMGRAHGRGMRAIRWLLRDPEGAVGWHSLDAAPEPAPIEGEQPDGSVRACVGDRERRDLIKKRHVSVMFFISPCPVDQVPRCPR